MTRQHSRWFIVVTGTLTMALGIVIAAQDRFSLKSPNGVAFSEFKGYDTWQTVAVSATDDGIKTIVANPVMIKAYQDGIPGNGKPFPEGSMIAKIEWAKIPNPESPYAVTVPGTLKSVSFIEKASSRFRDTDGWGYAQFKYNATSKAFTPFGSDASFAKNLCHDCHLAVRARNFIFTSYAAR